MASLDEESTANCLRTALRVRARAASKPKQTNCGRCTAGCPACRSFQSAYLEAQDAAVARIHWMSLPTATLLTGAMGAGDMIVFVGFRIVWSNWQA